MTNPHQGTEAWLAAKCGKASASHMADIMAKVKSGGYSATRANYEATLVAERLTGKVEEGFKSVAMERGQQTEAEAIAAYSFMTDHVVELVGFIDHPKVSWSGCSPDGLIGQDGLIEVKSPLVATHLKTLLGSEKIDSGYMMQCQWQMAVTNRRWCDWVSFCPSLPENLKLYVQRIERDERMILELETEVSTFLRGVAQKVEELRKLQVRRGGAA